MIARDESADILPSLQAAAPHLSGYALCDTGSSDGTPDIASAFFQAAGVPGGVHHHEWRDFSHNRNLCLDAGASALGAACDFWLLLDADQVLVAPRGTANTTVLLSSLNLTSDSYMLEERCRSTVFSNVRLVSTRRSWRYRGATHEYIDVDEGNAAPPKAAAALPPGFYTIHESNFGRGGRVGKFERDAALLEAVAPGDPDYARSRFYLGNTYRALGRRDEAVRAWVERVRQGGWAEEVYMAALEVARALERGLDDASWRLEGATREALAAHLRRDVGDRPTADDVLAALGAATGALPYRQEAGHLAARVHRVRRADHARCYAAAADAARRGPHTPITLFSDADAVRFHIDDELCTCAFYVEGSRHEGLRACERLEAAAAGAAAAEGASAERAATLEELARRTAANKRWYLDAARDGRLGVDAAAAASAGEGGPQAARVAALEAEVAALRREVAAATQALRAIRGALAGVGV